MDAKEKTTNTVRPKIVVIDDDRQYLQELQEILELSGYETVVFSNPEAALKMIQRIKPQLLLLDLKMDNKNGFEVAKEIKFFPDSDKLPIIAITGFYTQKEYRLLITSFGMKDCLLKPFQPLDLISRIERYLNRNSSAHENMNTN